jgi:hypothetical protein
VNFAGTKFVKIPEEEHIAKPMVCSARAEVKSSAYAVQARAFGAQSAGEFIANGDRDR